MEGETGIKLQLQWNKVFMSAIAFQDKQSNGFPLILKAIPFFVHIKWAHRKVVFKPDDECLPILMNRRNEEFNVS